MVVVRRVIKRRKKAAPRKPTDAQRRKSQNAAAAKLAARVRADTATVTDECCTLPGISWEDQPTPCRHDCHYSEHAFRKSEALAPPGPIEPAPVRKDRMIFDTACGNCGKVLDIAEAVPHAASHKPIKHPTSVEVWDWPGAYGDGQLWSHYAEGRKPRKVRVAA